MDLFDRIYRLDRVLRQEFMRCMSREDDQNLQDWLVGYWPALFRNKPEGVIPALRAVCEDRSLDWRVRANAVDAVVALAQRQGTEALEQTLDWLARIAANEQEDRMQRLSVGNTLFDFPRERYRPLLEDLATMQTGSDVHFSNDDVERAYAVASGTSPAGGASRTPGRFTRSRPSNAGNSAGRKRTAGQTRTKGRTTPLWKRRRSPLYPVGSQDRPQRSLPL